VWPLVAEMLVATTPGARAPAAVAAVSSAAARKQAITRETDVLNV
jgi:hypothetical protein